MTFVPREATAATTAILAQRDALFASSHDYDTAVSEFSWPELTEFNFALEWFDVLAGQHPDRAAVTLVSADLSARSWSYAELSSRSDQVANWLSDIGVRRGDHVIVMLGNTIELWEVMLAITKIGAVAVPTSTLLSATDLEYRVEHGAIRAIVTESALAPVAEAIDAGVMRIGTGSGAPAAWHEWSDSYTAEAEFVPDGPTPAGDAALLYFTSGTTSQPKLVRHTHVSYPVGHLSTMWWLGLKPGDVHLNISSPGWGKHAWSNFYAPFLAQATVFIFTYERFDATQLMQVMQTHDVTTFCAPPTVWRMLIQADLTLLTKPPRELVGAGEPLNPEVISRVRAAWGASIRDGFGQTEMTCAIGNAPGQAIKDGSMGKPMPGYPILLADPVTGEVREDEGEICLDLSVRTVGLMDGYYNDLARTAEACRDGMYHTGDIASRDADGYLTYVGRADDVFKASDYKISPFEVESVLMEHPFVIEAAVVPSPDELRLAVPKAYVRLTEGGRDHEAAARSIFDHCRQRLSGWQRVRILEFADDLPKTISGKIRRVELRGWEAERVAQGGDAAGQHFERDYRG
ncbi:AMP-binding protein (plasmid) [Coraliomargarita sp. W4R53]